jgi:hypothetical protein
VRSPAVRITELIAMLTCARAIGEMTG